MSAYTSPEHHPAFEEYCETIYELNEDGLKVIQARIAERLNVSRPAVSEMVKRLAEEGLVDTSGSEIVLTSKGKELADTMVRRHRLAERFLTDMLGLSWSEAHHEAGKWEHVISPRVEQAIIDRLDNPTTCPHGNPIPGSTYVEPDLVTLSTVTVGQQVTVNRIPEELEFEPGLLEYLEENHLLPGARATIVAMAPDGTATVDIEGQIVGLSAFTSERILVTSGS